jgi:hypothetical protein
MDLAAGGSGDGALVDSSVLVEKTFTRARQGDVIIADHFEMALRKTRHQLFLSWSTDGVDKQLNLIIAGNARNFDELCKLAQQYQVSVKSFRQKPFNADEAAAFLGFYLFPDRPIGNLSIPPLLRNQFSQAHGRVGNIVEIAERAGDQITSAPLHDSESMRHGSRVIVAVLVAVPLIIGAAWYVLDQSPPGGQMSVGEIEPAVVTEVPPQPAPRDDIEESRPISTTVAAPADTAAADATADDSELLPTVTDEHDGVTGKLAPVEAPAVTTSPADEPLVAVTPAAADEIVATAEPVPAQAQVQVQQATENDDAVAVDSAQSDSAVTSAAQVESAPSASGRLQRDLQTSLEWINGRDSDVGTLQVMVLTQKRFDERIYYRYVERLARQGVDISQLRIFETYTNNQRVFSVVFGEFPGRGAANAAKANLPKILLEAAPIPRSVGGLIAEIQRLEAEN